MCCGGAARAGGVWSVRIRRLVVPVTRRARGRAPFGGRSVLHDAARRAGIDLLGLGGLYAGEADQAGFLMGFAAHAPDELEAAVRGLASVLRNLER